MIFFDTTKTARSAHHSGLMRVSSRLLAELGPQAVGVQWPNFPSAISSRDWFVTAEVFSEAERSGLSAFLERHSCRTAAVFHDAIPLKLPHITWPQSVARHPSYLKLLSRFDRVWAVSQSSKHELEGFWRWQGVVQPPSVDVLSLGADFNGLPRVGSGGRPDRHPVDVAVGTAAAISKPIPQLLCVGILEPRKNQLFLLDLCEQLWREGERFELHLVGRVNPHFGPPIVERFKQLSRAYRGAVSWHEAVDDAKMAQLYGNARATVFPTIAEGYGLPLLESLWMGVPCVCSDLPVLRENADAGGCVCVPLNDAHAWTDALRKVLTDDSYVAGLRQQATTRPLPTWADAAATLRRDLG